MGKIIYITGLSGSGKTTIAKALQKRIPGSILLDGDEIRSTVNKDLGFSTQDKIANISRNNELISLLYEQGHTVICAFMSSIESERDKLFAKYPEAIKIQLTTPLFICQERDPKGHYGKYLFNFAGVDTPYPTIKNPDVALDTSVIPLDECVQLILNYSTGALNG